MTTNPLLKIVAGLALVLAVISLFIAFGSHGKVVLGSTGQPATVVPNAQWFSGGITIGQTGTFNQNTQFGACNLVGGAAGITASTTRQFDCAVKGIKSGDFVLEDPTVNMTPGNLGDIYPIGARASTTPGFITFTMLNLSGAASTTLGSNVVNGIEYLTYR